MSTATCTQCGTQFPSTRSTAAYCSPACRQRAYRDRQPKRNAPTVTVPGEPVIPASPGADRGYPLDFITPMRYVAAAIEDAGPRGISLEDLARGYRHPNSGDISRVMSKHALGNEYEAHRYLVDRAVSAFGAKLRPPTRGYGWRLAVPFNQLGVTRNY